MQIFKNEDKIFLKYLYLMDINLCYLGPFFLKSKGQNLLKKMVPSREIFLGGNVNILEIRLFFSENL